LRAQSFFPAFLKVDYSIDCNTGTHTAIMLFAGVMIIVTQSAYLYGGVLEGIRRSTDAAQKIRLAL
jgi:hypothetical protein